MERDGISFKIKEITRSRCEIRRVRREVIAADYLALKLQLLVLLQECASLGFSLFVLLDDELIEYIKPAELSKEYIQEIIRAGQNPVGKLQFFIKTADQKVFFTMLDALRRQRISVLAADNRDMNPKILEVIANICAVTPKLVHGGIDLQVAGEITMMAGGIVETMTHDAIILRALVKMIKLDPALYDHSVTVAILGGVIARNILKLPTHDIGQIIEAGLYHDIGKTCLPAHIQLKNGKYDHEEQSLMRTHTILGYEELNKAISKGAKIDRLVAKVALEHHERFSGQGYPRGLKGRAEEDKSSGIHLYSRVVMIADTFCSLIIDKMHHGSYSVEDSVRIMAATADEEFDPVIVHAFLRQVLQSFYDPEKIREIYPIKKKDSLFYAA